MRSVMVLPAPEAPSKPTAPLTARNSTFRLKFFQLLFDAHFKRGVAAEILGMPAEDCTWK
jgi:hypothetical protein